MNEGDKLVFFDLETGGLDPSKHAVIQIAAVACVVARRGKVELVQAGEFESKLLFDLEAAEEQALNVNSFNQATWADEAKMPSVACRDFSQFLKRHATNRQISKRTQRPYYVANLAGYNGATFDKPFLWKLYSRQRDSFVPGHPQVFDVLQLAKWTAFSSLGDAPLPANFKLETVAKWLGLDVGDGQTHDALDDVRLLVDVTERLLQIAG